MGAKGPSVVCRLQYSGAALGLPAALAGATLALLAMAPGPSAGRVLGGTATACAGLAAARRLTPRWGGTAPRTLVVRASGEVAVKWAGGGWSRGTLRDGSFVAPWLLIVRWRPEGGRLDRSLLVLPGMSDAETMRKIRVILRWR